MRRRRGAISQVSSDQVKAAPALLRWTQVQFVKASVVSLPTVKWLEMATDRIGVRSSTGAALRIALEAAGIELLRPMAAGEV